uniref:Uncharacterized protein n=1 Tax=viral metagenome TaxID=1070528 RepID=A0A6M3LLH0_9ZZZZ
MDGLITSSGQAAILITAVINLAAVSFGGGKLWQIASTNAKRLDKIDNKLETMTNHVAKQGERISRMEGKP